MGQQLYDQCMVHADADTYGDISKTICLPPYHTEGRHIKSELIICVKGDQIDKAVADLEPTQGLPCLYKVVPPVRP